jgi:hypothetical protein
LGCSKLESIVLTTRYTYPIVIIVYKLSESIPLVNVSHRKCGD